MDDVQAIDVCQHIEAVAKKTFDWKRREKFRAHCPTCGEIGLPARTPEGAMELLKDWGSAPPIAPTAHQMKRRAIPAD